MSTSAPPAPSITQNPQFRQANGFPIPQTTATVTSITSTTAFREANGIMPAQVVSSGGGGCGLNPLCHGYDFARGAANAGKEAVTGTIDAITNPIETAQGVWRTAESCRKAFIPLHECPGYVSMQRYVQQWQTEGVSYTLGAIAFDAATIVLGVKAVNRATALSATNTVDDIAGAASRAASNVGPGSGSVYGTRVHTAFADEIAALGRSDLFSEVSYLNGRVVPYGTPGSVRLDVVVGSPSAPTAIWDLKTGSAALTPARVAQIQSHLPPGFQNVPVLEVRP